MSSKLDIRPVPIARVRNLGIMAHVDAGKTTTTERILFYTGVTSRLGEVDDGSSFTDWMEQEQERGISITAAAITFAWQDCVVNLIDTPGHVDFTMEVERSLRVLDGAIAVFDAVAGVQPQSETVWRQADRYRVPRLAFINKCDREGAEPARVVAEMKTRLGAQPIAIQIALDTDEDAFAGVIDLIAMRARVWDEASFGVKFTDSEIPAAQRDAARAARDQMIEAIAELDDVVMTAFVSGRELTPELIHASLRRLTLANRAVPTLLGAAFHNQGIHNLLDAVVAYLPSPVDVGPVHGRQPDDREQLAALAFKVADSGAPGASGQLTFVRVYAGTLRVGDRVLNATRGHLETIDGLCRMFANRREDLNELPAGMIGAIVGRRGAGASSLGTGDTLCDPRAPIVLDAMVVPAAVIGVTVEPETIEDHAKLLAALDRLAVEDPSFHVRTDVETGHIVISGMGELHLEIILDRIRREFGVQARAGQPVVAYRETVTRRGEGEHKFTRGLGGRGEYGHVRLVVEPTDRGGGYVYQNSAPESEIPREHAGAVEDGVSEAVERGVLAGRPMTDLRVQVVGGSCHPIDSNNFAFKTASGRAFVAAAEAAAPTLLEPVMSLEVTTPDDSVGDVLGDLHARRGKVAGITARPGVQTVACFVPMASMFGYATDLRSRTKGRATYSMELDHYAEVPQQLRDDLKIRTA